VFCVVCVRVFMWASVCEREREKERKSQGESVCEVENLQEYSRPCTRTHAHMYTCTHTHTHARASTHTCTQHIALLKIQNKCVYSIKKYTGIHTHWNVEWHNVWVWEVSSETGKYLQTGKRPLAQAHTHTFTKTKAGANIQTHSVTYEEAGAHIHTRIYIDTDTNTQASKHTNMIAFKKTQARIRTTAQILTPPPLPPPLLGGGGGASAVARVWQRPRGNPHSAAVILPATVAWRGQQ